ncbi:BgTH12-02187 [Blumeria graminis f. sp. triticale]|uniref:BgTH12-02187 n=1 Tax=Blumeria graminis f. sp. triticale TaxID=1689686 RepID=A0A9W4D0Y7_BLUGR|nr:BgTH12-02187 [Blumeria graminis f. sp. triticale]
MTTQKCILAFLRSFSTTLPTPKQLILVDNQENENYNVYQISPIGNFPSGFPPAIIKSSTEFNFRGTSSTMYCSNKMNHVDMRLFITRGMPVITTMSAKTFASREVRAKTKACLSHLENAWNNNLAVNPQSNVFLKKSEAIMGRCSDGSLTRLAFTRYISFVEDYSCLNPSKEMERIKIKADAAIDMGQVVFDSKILKIPGPQGKEWGLAWYQYHIHVFEFDNSRNLWFPITIIGNEWNNGKAIYEALQFDSNMGEFRRRSEAIGRSDQLNNKALPNILTKTASISSQYQNIRSDIKFRNLHMSVVTGSLGCRQPLENSLPEKQSSSPLIKPLNLSKDMRADKSPLQQKVNLGDSPKPHLEVNEGSFPKPDVDTHSSHREVPLPRSGKSPHSLSDGNPFQETSQTSQRKPSRESRPQYNTARHHHRGEGSHSKSGKEPFQEVDGVFYSRSVPVHHRSDRIDSDSSYDGGFHSRFDDVPHSHHHEDPDPQPNVEFGEGAYMNRMSESHQKFYHGDHPGHSQGYFVESTDPDQGYYK